jgi:putative two-component system response regulator
MMNQIPGLSLSATFGVSLVNNNSAKVLIVDDRPLSRLATVDLLSLDGYEVLETEGDTAIVENIIAQMPDLVLLDAMTKQVDSFDLCRQIKSDRRTEDIPVVLMTVGDSREERLKGVEVGVDDFLIKPLDRIELSTRVKSLIDRKRLNEGLDQTQQVLFSIAKAIESRSSNSGGSAKIISLAQSFGEYLQLPPPDIENLVFAAHLHDIGEIAIPDAVMLKKGELTAEERDLIRQHVLVGEKICQPLRNRREVLPIIRNHHERWDGTGYPDGLAGDRIPVLAQVFQILDIYQALTSDRPHKQACSPTQAIAIMAEETAKGWRNPQLVEAFTKFIETCDSLVSESR